MRHDHGAPDHCREECSEGERPAGHQRQRNALQAIHDEGARAATMEGEVRKIAGNKEERRHPEGVQHVEEDGEGHAALVVHDDKDGQARRRRKE